MFDWILTISFFSCLFIFYNKKINIQSNFLLLNIKFIINKRKDNIGSWFKSKLMKALIDIKVKPFTILFRKRNNDVTGFTASSPRPSQCLPFYLCRKGKHNKRTLMHPPSQKLHRHTFFPLHVFFFAP